MHRKTTDLEYHRDGRVVIDADGVDLDMTGYAGKIDEAAAVTAASQSAKAAAQSAAEAQAAATRPVFYTGTGAAGQEPTWPRGAKPGDTLLNTATLELWKKD